MQLRYFLRLAKAFDIVSLPILLQKLENHFGVKGIALDWFKGYLLQRKQCVKASNFESRLNTVTFDVPQGRILDLILFIMNIDDIHDCAYNDIICYADDTAIIIDATSRSEYFSQAELRMKQASKWLRYNLLKLNITKTKYMSLL